MGFFKKIKRYVLKSVDAKTKTVKRVLSVILALIGIFMGAMGFYLYSLTKEINSLFVSEESSGVGLMIFGFLLFVVAIIIIIPTYM